MNFRMSTASALRRRQNLHYSSASAFFRPVFTVNYGNGFHLCESTSGFFLIAVKNDECEILYSWLLAIQFPTGNFTLCSELN